MARIIPWSLPEVRGGSIGGYTPRSEDSDPEPPAKYYDFDNAVISLNGTPNQVGAGTGSAGVKVVDMGAASWSSILSGVQIINLVGVASLSVKIVGTYDGSDFDIIYDVALDTFRLSLDTGTVEPGIVSTNCQVDISEYTFYVYNGNGEILQYEVIEVE